MNSLHTPATATFLCLCAASWALKIHHQGAGRQQDPIPLEQLKVSASQANSKLVWLMGDSNNYFVVRDTCEAAQASITFWLTGCMLNSSIRYLVRVLMSL
mmetsp:Transcript_67505/g.124223  ORF Transcript_67505/g.124223 Transcript_67505/m.124223 type:complete len:100 (+) Transcript_67505:2-301(+)